MLYPIELRVRSMKQKAKPSIGKVEYGDDAWRSADVLKRYGSHNSSKPSALCARMHEGASEVVLGKALHGEHRQKVRINPKSPWC